MGRLVDIDDVIKAVDKHTKDCSEIVLDDDITCILEEVPTAFDVEKVVAELEQLKSNKGFGGTLQTMYADGKIDKAIDIVKKGGAT